MNTLSRTARNRRVDDNRAIRKMLCPDNAKSGPSGGTTVTLALPLSEGSLTREALGHSKLANAPGKLCIESTGADERIKVALDTVTGIFGHGFTTRTGSHGNG